MSQAHREEPAHARPHPRGRRETPIPVRGQGVASCERRMPDAIKILRSTRLLGFEAFMAAEKGDIRASLDRLRTGLRFAPKIAEESSLIAYLIALADVKLCLLFLNRSLERSRGRRGAPSSSARRPRRAADRTLESPSPKRRPRREDPVLGPRPRGRQAVANVRMGRDWWERLVLWLIRPLIKRDIRHEPSDLRGPGNGGRVVLLSDEGFLETLQRPSREGSPGTPSFRSWPSPIWKRPS